MNAESILKQMTLEDKIALCSGQDFWETKAFEKYGIPPLFMCDGPVGLRKQETGKLAAVGICRCQRGIAV